MFYDVKGNEPPSVARGSEDETTGNDTPNKINNEDQSNDMIITTPPSATNMDVFLMGTNNVSEDKGNQTEEIKKNIDAPMVLLRDTQNHTTRKESTAPSPARNMELLLTHADLEEKEKESAEVSIKRISQHNWHWFGIILQHQQ